MTGFLKKCVKPFAVFAGLAVAFLLARQVRGAQKQAGKATQRAERYVAGREQTESALEDASVARLEADAHIAKAEAIKAKAVRTLKAKAENYESETLGAIADDLRGL